MDKIRKDIETACQEIASNVRKYESGSYDYEHYVATFEGEQNFIIGLVEDAIKKERAEVIKEIDEEIFVHEKADHGDCQFAHRYIFWRVKELKKNQSE